MSERVTQRRVTTRKAHRCFGCNTRYPAGSKMWYFTDRDGGGLHSYYWCSVCDAAWHLWGFRHDDSVCRGEMRDNDPLEWERVRESQESEFEELGPSRTAGDVYEI